MLEEVIDICPPAVIDLITHLMKTLRPGKAQTRYIELGPIKWWLKNIWRCPLLLHLLMGNREMSHYVLTGASLRVTNLPIFSRATKKNGLRFVEVQWHLSLLTIFSMLPSGSAACCKHYSRDSWTTDGTSEDSLNDILVCYIYSSSVQRII